MGVILTKALASQPQALRVYLMHAVSRILCLWLPHFSLYLMKKNGIGFQWKIQGHKSPKRALSQADAKKYFQEEFFAMMFVQYVMNKFMTVDVSDNTVLGTMLGAIGTALGSVWGAKLGWRSRQALTSSIGGAVGGCVGTVAGARLVAFAASKMRVKQLEDAKPCSAKSMEEGEGVEKGWSGLRCTGQAPSLWTHVWQVAVAYAGYDAMFYWSHRLMHHPKLYKHCHKIHHEYHTPIALACSHHHVIEGLVQLFNWFVPIAFAGWLNKGRGGMHESTLFYYNCFRWLETVDAHSGYELPFSPFKLLPICAGARGHDFHHREFNGNYGATIFWDRLCGTDKDFWKEILEEGVLMAGQRKPF